MNDRWSDQLSDYLDGTLSREERRGLEEHLESCAECAATLESLRDLVVKARALRDRGATAVGGTEPEPDLWPGIEARIRDLPVSTVRPLPEPGNAAAGGRWALPSFPRLFAAAAALLLV